MRAGHRALWVTTCLWADPQKMPLPAAIRDMGSLLPGLIWLSLSLPKPQEQAGLRTAPNEGPHWGIAATGGSPACPCRNRSHLRQESKSPTLTHPQVYPLLALGGGPTLCPQPSTPIRFLRL